MQGPEAGQGQGRGGGAPAYPTVDRRRRADVRLATGCALGFCALTFLVDWDAETLTLPRALLWLTLSAGVLAVLLPPRVAAGPGLLAVSGPVRRRQVRTDALVAVRQYAGASAHLVLSDAHGHRLELDPRVLTGDPLLWHELDTGARRSLERGTLREGAEVLERLRHEIDDPIAQAILKASGLP
ncbi:hypothetical protein [Streptomyces sp. 3214.6]|uniref:hypothetical protein n=1 Tax=Streptomyces sp. 3214.6 TaxID=1882757 RepID=UPI00090A352B|nr:hypothetical protein [Streptomyces sp. 3214.6]SHI41567.1 hypothetical protein SAMN05444521_7461 [Streptomyces sp. 3214.6]